VLFAGSGERLEIKHQAHSRTALASGAVRAAQWVVNKEPGILIMGSVKPSYIKNFAMDLLRTYESSFSPDFEANKLKVSEYTDIKNKNIRNRVAGYISNVMRQRSTRRGEVEVDV